MAAAPLAPAVRPTRPPRSTADAARGVVLTFLPRRDAAQRLSLAFSLLARAAYVGPANQADLGPADDAGAVAAVAASPHLPSPPHSLEVSP
jgi:hypothetical protein